MNGIIIDENDWDLLSPSEIDAIVLNAGYCGLQQEIQSRYRKLIFQCVSQGEIGRLEEILGKELYQELQIFFSKNSQKL